MEMSFAEYKTHINTMLQEETIYKAANNLKPLGKFIMSENGQLEPVKYEGYTLITPTLETDYENTHSYDVLMNVKKELSKHLDSSKCIEAPDNALHMTVARLISGEAFETTMKGIAESKFLDYIKVLFSKLAVSSQLSFEQRQQSPTSSGGGFSIGKAVSGETQSPTDVVQTPRASGARRYSLRELVPDSFRYKRFTKFEITGISVFPQGVIAAMVCPVDEDDHICLQNLREYIYSDKTIKEMGVERKRKFSGHITLCYIENELEGVEKLLLSEAIIKINERFFSRPLPFFIRRAEVRRFNNFLSFDREENWAFFEFIKLPSEDDF